MPKLSDLFRVRISCPEKQDVFLVAFNRSLDITNSENCEKVTIRRGIYDLVRVPNPFGFAEPWLMMKDGTAGAAEKWWRDQEKAGVVYLERLLY